MTDQERIDQLLGLLSQLEPLMQGFPSMVNRLSSLQKHYDQQHKDAYHALEVIDMNASTGAKFLKQYKRLSRERRENKLLLEMAQDIQGVFTNKEVNLPQGVNQQVDKVRERIQGKARTIAHTAKVNGQAFIEKAVNQNPTMKRISN